MKEKNIEQIIGNSYMFNHKQTIGIYLNHTAKSMVFIDSGVNEKEAQKIHQYIKKIGYNVNAIIVTHGHMSQYGGILYMKNHYKHVKVYATAWTVQFIENLLLEPCFIGSIPKHSLKYEQEREKFKHIVTDILPYYDHKLLIDNQILEIVTLPGHFPGMIGIITPDEVFYVADAIFGNKTLRKQTLLYFTDIKAAQHSLHKLIENSKAAYVLTHGGKYDNIYPLVEQHMKLIQETIHFIVATVREQALTLEKMTQKMMNKYQMQEDPKHLTLTQFITKAYLIYLEDEKKLISKMKEGQLYYEIRVTAP